MKKHILGFYCILCVLIIAPVIVSCGSSGGGDNGANEVISDVDSDNFKVNISGFVDLPHFESAENLFVVFEDLETKDFLYEGQTDIDGGFSGSIVVSNNHDRILIIAIDLNNIDAHAMALVDLIEPTSYSHHNNYTSEVQTASNEIDISINVNSRTTAEVVVLSAAGMLGDHLPSDLSPDQLNEVEDLAMDLEISGTQFCSGSDTRELETDLHNSLKSRNISRMKSLFDDILQSQGLVAAQQEVSDKVWASNRDYDPWLRDAYASVALGWTRIKIKGVVPELSIVGYTEDNNYRMPIEKLSLITDIIMTDGVGNCRENAFVGAYIASRIKKFKQVAVVGLNGEDGGDGHGLAIGCEEGVEIYNITDFRDKWLTTSDDPLMQGLLKAKCTIIDPWKRETLDAKTFLDKWGSDDRDEIVHAVIPIILDDDTNRINSIVNHITSNLGPSCDCSVDDIISGFCSAPVEVKAIHIRAKNIKVNAVIHYGSGDQHYVGEDTRNFHSEIDEPSSFSNYTFFQSYTSEDGNRTKEMSVTFNPGLTKVIKFDAESDTTVTGDNIPGGSYNQISEISGTSTFDVDSSNHRLFKIAGAEACDKIDIIKFSQTGEGVSNWEVLGVANWGCDEEAELTIEITTN